FLKAVVEGVHGGVQIVQEDKADERESEVAAGLRQSLAKLRAVNEARDVVKGGGAEKSFDCLNHKDGAISARNSEIAPKEEPHLAKHVDHAMDASAEGSRLRPVR